MTNIMEDSLLLVLLIVCSFSIFMSILTGGYYFYNLKKKGDKCDGEDVNGKYVIDEYGDCVLEKCDNGYKISVDGEKCIRDTITKPPIEDAAVSFSTCEEINSLISRRGIEEVKAYCDKQEYCSWLDNTCKSIVTFADGSTATINPDTYTEDGISSSQLTEALSQGQGQGQYQGPPPGKTVGIDLRIPSAEVTPASEYVDVSESDLPFAEGRK